MILVETAFAVDAVECAHLSIGRHEVDTQRDAEAAAMYGAENGRRIYDSFVTFVFWITVGHEMEV